MAEISAGLGRQLGYCSDVLECVEAAAEEVAVEAAEDAEEYIWSL